jgi:N-methylhydantoinase B
MSSRRLDGGQLAILNARFRGVARKMSNTLLRTGRSGVLNRARDFSCCIVTASGDLLSAADSLPIHVLSGPDIMARTMVEYHPELRRGDAFLHNSPYHGCSHPADHTLLVPVLDDAGRHRFTVLAKAHQADIGNSVPTTYYGAARDVYHEGALIFPAVKLQSGGEFDADLIRMCRMRIRVPEQWYGDLLAMVGAARIGERAVAELAEEYGWDTLDDFAEQWFDYSEQRMATALAALPSGRVRGRSTHDALPGVVDHEIPVDVVVDVDAHAGHVRIDLRDNLDCLPCGLNVSEACARTAAMIGIFNAIDHAIPKNAGSFRRLEILIRKGSLAGGAVHPYSCSVSTTNVSDRIANAVQTALASMGDGIGMAEVGASIPASHGVISGLDPRTNERFVNQVFLGSSSGGASPHADGRFHYSHAGNAGMGYIDSVELAEQYQPIRIYARGIVPDTEGAGRRSGAPSKHIEFGPVDCSIEVAYVTDGCIHNAQGVRGGTDGGPAHQHALAADGTTLELPTSGVVTLGPGQRIVSTTGGGGGYGDPRTRDPRAVEDDVREGWISSLRALEIYGRALPTPAHEREPK